MSYKRKLFSEVKFDKTFSENEKKNNINPYSSLLHIKKADSYPKKQNKKKSLLVTDYTKKEYKDNNKSFFYTNSNFNEYVEGSKFIYLMRKHINSTKMNTKSGLDSFHSNLLKEKLFQLKRNTFTFLNNFSQNKKKYFITGMDDDQNDEESTNKLTISNKVILNPELDAKMQINKKNKIKNSNKTINPEFINNRSLHYSSNKTINNQYFNTISNINNSNKILQRKNFTFSKKNLDFRNLNEIKKPTIKFNKTLNDYFSNLVKYNEIGTNNESINTLIKCVKTKFRHALIKQLHKEKLLRLQEEKEQLNLITNQATTFKIAEKYFFSLADSLRRYVMFLFSQINEANKELKNLRQKKDKLLKEVHDLRKRINNKIEEKKFLINVKQFCLMIKIGKNSFKDLPKSEYEKYGIIKSNNFIKNNKNNKSISKNNLKSIKFKKLSKRQSFTLQASSINLLNYSEYRRAKTPKLKPNYNMLEGSGKFNIKNQFSKIHSNKKRRATIVGVPFRRIKKVEKQEQIEIFNNAEEFVKRFKEIEKRIKDEYQAYNKIYEQNFKIKKEKKKLELYYEKNTNTDYEEHLFEELNKEKTKNKQLNKKKYDIFFECYGRYPKSKNSSVKSMKLLTKNKNYFKNIVNDNITTKRENENLIYDKIKDIVLNFDINIEEFLGVFKFYENISNNDRKYINYNGCQYSVAIYILKIIELLHLKLVQWKNSCMENPALKKEYQKLKHKREKITNIIKVKQRQFEENQKRLKTKEKVMTRTNKILFLPLKKIDPFEKKILEDNEIIKNNYNKRKKSFNTYQVYEGFIKY